MNLLIKNIIGPRIDKYGWSSLFVWACIFIFYNNKAIGQCGSPITTFPVHETFNGSTTWTQSNNDDFDWTIRSGGTPSSGTGPAGAYEGSHYIYIEASNPNYPDKDAKIESPCYSISSYAINPSISFKYHMKSSSNSNNMGKLELKISTNGGSNWSKIWDERYDQGSSWKTATISLNSYKGDDVMFQFKAKTYNSWQSDICVDDLIISASVFEDCTNGVDDDGDGLVDCDDSDCTIPTIAITGDTTQCYNGYFTLQGTATPPTYSSTWSVESGPAFIASSTTNQNVEISLSQNNTSDIKYTLNSSGHNCSVEKVVTLSNTTSCDPSCIDPINYNGDLEDEGTATNFNLSMESTPALLIDQTYYPTGWADRYGNATPNTTNFYGAFYLNKTGAQGDPNSGSHFMFLNGNDFCVSPLYSQTELSCGKKYKMSVWIAAYNFDPNGNATQVSSPFALEYAIGGGGAPYFSVTRLLEAPTSNSWNDLNWQKYDIILDIPNDGYTWCDFYVTSKDNGRGILIDDLCITEYFPGASADAGQDFATCVDTFYMNADSIPPGYTGTWSIISGDLSVESPNDLDSKVTINNGVSGVMRWTVTDGSCSSSDEVVVAYDPETPITIDDVTICPGENATLFVDNCTDDVSWSTGESTTSISVAPGTTTTYSVSCTEPPSANIMECPDFETTPQFDYWSNWAGSKTTNDPSKVHTGTYAAMMEAINGWVGLEQTQPASPGEVYEATFYAFTDHPRQVGYAFIRFLDGSDNVIKEDKIEIDAVNYQQYTLTGISPPNTQFIKFGGRADNPQKVYIDDVILVRKGGCASTASGTVIVDDCEICVNGIDDDNDGATDCEDFTCGQLINREFDDSLNDWFLHNSNGNTSNATLDRNSMLSGKNSALVEITNSSNTEHWHTQFGQSNFDIEYGKKYKVEFMARANGFKDIAVTLELDKAPWTNYFHQVLNVTTTPATYSYEFYADTTLTDDVNLIFHVGKDDTNIWIDRVQFKEDCQVPGNDSIYLDAECADVGTAFTIDSDDALAAGDSYISYGGSTVLTDPGNDPVNFVRFSAAVTSTGAYKMFARTIASGSASNSYFVRVNGGDWTVWEDIPTSLSWQWNIVKNSNINDTLGLYLLEGINTIDIGRRESGTKIDKIFVTGYDDLPSGEGGSPANCPETFKCDSKFYQTIKTGGEYWLYEIQTYPTLSHIPLVNITDRGALGDLNATSFNVNDGYIYTMNKHYPFRLYRIGGDFSVHYLGNIKGINPTADVNAGDIGDNNVVYVRDHVHSDIYRLDISNMSQLQATLHCNFPNMSGGLSNVPDLAYNPTDNKYYGTRNNSNQLVAYDVDNCTFSTITTSQVMTSANGAFFISADGTGYGYQNSSGTILRINLTSGLIDTVGVSLPTTDNDGCSCEGIKFFKDATDICVEESDVLTFEYAIHNKWVNNLSSITLRDTLAHGLLWNSEPYDVTGGTVGPSSISGNAIGDLTITSSPIGITTFKIDVLVPSNYSGPTTYYSQAYLEDLPVLLTSTKKSDYPDSPEIDDPTPVHIIDAIEFVDGTDICVGSTKSITPSSGGIWNSSNPAIAVISNDGTITGISAGKTTLLFQNSTTGCLYESDSITVYNPVSAAIDFNGHICLDDDSQLTGIGSGGTGNYSYSWSGPNGFTSSLQTIDIDEDGYYYVTVTDLIADCFTAAIAFVHERYEPLIVTLNSEVCDGESVDLNINSPTAVSYQWDTNANNSTSNAVTVTPSLPNTTYTVTVTNDLGCSADADVTIDVNPLPTVDISGPNAVCIGETSNLTPSSGGTWISNNPAVATVNNSGVVTGVSAGTSTFQYTNSSTSCVSNASAQITVHPKPVVQISGPDSLCIGETSDMLPSNGGSWVSNNPTVATITSEGLVTAITDGIATFTFTNSVTSCPSDPSDNIVVSPTPSVTITGPSDICQDATTTLSPTAGGTWTSSNPLVASVSNNGVVTGMSVGSAVFTYVSNAGGCQAPATSSVSVQTKPIVTNTGSNDICEGSFTILNPGTGGTWTTSDPTIATVTNNGVVTGVSPGTATFTYQTFNLVCTASLTTPITIHENPVVTLVGNPMICEGDTTRLTSSLSGTWTVANSNIGSISSTGLLTGLDGGIAEVIFETSDGCKSDTTFVLVNPIVNTGISGPDSICIGSTTTLFPNSGGTWTSSNPSVASVSNSGIVSALSDGKASFTFVSNANCTSPSTDSIVIDPDGSVTVTGATEMCMEDTIQLSASVAGGNWVSSNTNLATIGIDGKVVALAPGLVSLVYEHNTSSCIPDPIHTVQIFEKPAIAIPGNTKLCVGSSIVLATSIPSGVWTSSDPSVATINALGEVTPIAPGEVYFSIEHPTSGCTSDLTDTFSVHPAVTSAININGSACLEDTTQLTVNPSGGTSPFTYTWTGPNGLTGNTQTIDIPIHGSYYVTVTDQEGCTSNISSFVYERFDPFIFSLHQEVCDGQEITLSVNSPAAVSYQWGVNAGNATTSSVNVTPSMPSTHYEVFVSSDAGCSTIASADIDVHPIPVVTLVGDTTICVNDTTYFAPSSGGIWTSSNSAIAIIDFSGKVVGKAPGNASFTYQNSLTGCISQESTEITVISSSPVAISGEDNYCIGSIHTLSTNVPNGTWTSSNPAVAVVESLTGEVTGIAPGTANIIYTPPANLCSTPGSLPIVVNNYVSVSIVGASKICEGDYSQLSPASGGTWTSNDPSIATVTNSGVVTGVSAGSTTFTFTSNAGCSSTTITSIEVVDKIVTSLNGPSDICIGETTTLSPSSGGIWVSNNNSVGFVSASGTVTGISAGTATFSFYESSNGCKSDNDISIIVHPSPSTTFTGPSAVCIGDTTYITPSTGGVWTSSDDEIASINNSGEIIALKSGLAQFTFTNTTTGCVSSTSSALTVNAKPLIDLAGQDKVCLDGTIYIAPNIGGTWVSTDPSIATITNSGEITGVSTGNVSFIFTNNLTTCPSDTSTSIEVVDKPTVQYDGPQTVCVGESTNLLPNTGGLWTSSNNNIATVTSSGIVNTLSAGTVNFTFSSLDGVCSSEPTGDLTILAKPNISVSGSTSICVGSTTQMIPSSGGTWMSDNPSIATIDNSGLVTAISSGTVKFTYTDGTTGCESDASTTITVLANPVGTISGPSDICLNGVTNLSPSSGGFWSSNNPTVASVTSSGLVTGLSIGSATFTFTESSSGCVSNPTAPVNVLSKPTITLTGPNQICVEETTTLTPSTGGTWFSLNPSVATITNTGVVTAVAQGLAQFVYTTDAGCQSNPSAPISVFGKPNILNISNNELCVGSTISLLPNSGGTWESTDTMIAKITDQGVVTGVMQGLVKFYFTDDVTGCVSDTSDFLTVQPSPQINLIGADEICVGGNTQLSPTTGGLWYSNDPSIAIISSSGEVTGISGGTTTFYYVNISTNCASDSSDQITIIDKPETQYVTVDEMCIGDTVYMTPSTGGSWISTNSSVASINNQGRIISHTQGVARFKFIRDDGCESDLSAPLTVHGNPSVSLSGPSIICTEATTTLNPTSGGIWMSEDPSIASVTNDGIVTGVGPGSTGFIFTDNTTGCSTDNSLNIQVSLPPTITLDGSDEICAGFHTQVSASSTGSWVSDDNRILTVSNTGQVLGIAPGKAKVMFVDGTSGCSTGSNSPEVTVGKCINHDFNVTRTNIDITGDISTNDLTPPNTTYGLAYVNTSKPLQSTPDFTINADGTYSFRADKAGKYYYDVSICQAPATTGCLNSTLEFTVLGDIFSHGNPVNNLEFVTANASTQNGFPGPSIDMDVMANDQCVLTLGCNLNMNASSIIHMPEFGTSSMNLLGKVAYAPNSAHIGYDTLMYSICSDDANGLCSSSLLFVTTQGSNAPNSVVAPDDFRFTMTGVNIVGNVLDNDSDPNGDNFSVTPMGNVGSPISITGGAYYIASSGDFTFIPEEGFVGNTSFVYTVCDDNVEQACMNATVHLMIAGDMTIKTRVYLEGALMTNGNQISQEGRPLMRDDLRVNPYNGKNYVPLNDPYSGSVGLIDLTSKFGHLGPGLLAENKTITDSMAIFGVNGDNAIVDWVFLELRLKSDSTQAFATRAALVQRDGDVVDLDGASDIRFNSIGVDSFYLVVRHRNHLGAMSQLIGNDEFVDFTNPSTPVYDFGMSDKYNMDFTGLSMNSFIKTGYRALWAGDFDGNGKVKFTNPGDDQNLLLFDVIFHPDNTVVQANFDFGYGYTQGDYNLNGKVKFTNPDDDKNLLFSQLLLYPLNVTLRDNFNFFVQQVPE